MLDGPGLGPDRKVTPFIYEVEGRVGKQRYRDILEKMEKEGQGKLFKDPYFPANENVLFDQRINDKILEGSIEQRRKRRRDLLRLKWQNISFVRLKNYYAKETDFTLFN